MSGKNNIKIVLTVLYVMKMIATVACSTPTALQGSAPVITRAIAYPSHPVIFCGTRLGMDLSERNFFRHAIDFAG